MQLLGDAEAGALSELLLCIGNGQHPVEQNGQIMIPAGVGTFVKTGRALQQRFPRSD